jgi:hypothetical protein
MTFFVTEIVLLTFSLICLNLYYIKMRCSIKRRHNTHHNDIQYYDIQSNDTQYNDIQRNDNQHNGLICDTQHN